MTERLKDNDHALLVFFLITPTESPSLEPQSAEPCLHPFSSLQEEREKALEEGPREEL